MAPAVLKRVQRRLLAVAVAAVAAVRQGRVHCSQSRDVLMVGNRLPLDACNSTENTKVQTDTFIIYHLNQTAKRKSHSQKCKKMTGTPSRTKKNTQVKVITFALFDLYTLRTLGVGVVQMDHLPVAVCTFQAADLGKSQ